MTSWYVNKTTWSSFKWTFHFNTAIGFSRFARFKSFLIIVVKILTNQPVSKKITSPRMFSISWIHEKLGPTKINDFTVFRFNIAVRTWTRTHNLAMCALWPWTWFKAKGQNCVKYYPDLTTLCPKSPPVRGFVESLPVRPWFKSM